MLRKIMYGILIIVAFLFVVVLCYMSLPKFGRMPRGARLERIEKSPNYSNGQFHNLEATAQITAEKGRFRMMWDFLFEKKTDLRPDKPLPVIKTDLKSIDSSKDLFVWFGHSSYFIQSAGKRILVDPVFDAAAPVAFINRPFKGTDIYKAEDMPDIDFLVITHDHWDHLDYRTVRSLKNRVAKVICPLGVGEHFERWGYDTSRIMELEWNESINFDEGYSAHCLPARHFSGRGLRANRTLWASFMVETPSQTIYLGGDGGYGKHFVKIAERFPDIDLAFLENGQYSRNWRYIHLMPEYSGKVIEELNPAMVFLGHNSKYALSKHPWDEPLNNAAKLSVSKPIVLPRIGEVVLTNQYVRGGAEKWWGTN